MCQASQDIKKKIKDTTLKIEKNEDRRKEILEHLEKNIKILSHAEQLNNKIHQLKTAHQYELQRLKQAQEEYNREESNCQKVVQGAEIGDLRDKLSQRQKDFEEHGRGLGSIEEEIKCGEDQVSTLEAKKDDLQNKKSLLQSQVYAAGVM